MLGCHLFVHSQRSTSRVQTPISRLLCLSLIVHAEQAGSLASLGGPRRGRWSSTMLEWKLPNAETTRLPACILQRVHIRNDWTELEAALREQETAGL